MDRMAIENDVLGEYFPNTYTQRQHSSTAASRDEFCRFFLPFFD